MGPTETKCHLYSDSFKSRKNTQTMRIQSVYFLHHGASLRGSAGDCVYGGWAEVRLEALNSSKLLNKLKHAKENNMIWFFSSSHTKKFLQGSNVQQVDSCLPHCKLTRRRRSNSIDITVRTLWPHCSSSSDFTHKSKKSKFIWLHIKNSKHFCSFQ